MIASAKPEGAFQRGGYYAERPAGSLLGTSSAGVKFNSGLVVPTGKENAPQTLSVVYWRRVA